VHRHSKRTGKTESLHSHDACRSASTPICPKIAQNPLVTRITRFIHEIDVTHAWKPPLRALVLLPLLSATLSRKGSLESHESMNVVGKPQLRAKTFTPKALRVGPGRLRRYPIGGKIRRTASQYILLLRTSNDFLRRKKWNHAENCIEPRRTFTVKSRRRVDDGHMGRNNLAR